VSLGVVAVWHSLQSTGSPGEKPGHLHQPMNREVANMSAASANRICSGSQQLQSLIRESSALPARMSTDEALPRKGFLVQRLKRMNGREAAIVTWISETTFERYVAAKTAGRWLAAIAANMPNSAVCHRIRGAKTIESNCIVMPIAA
jgi:hypothetical protein